MWRLEGKAALAAQNTTASLALDRPGRGLFDWQLLDKPVPSVEILGADIQGWAGCLPPLREQYARGDDLVCGFGPTENWPFQVELRWKTIQVPGTLAGVELLVSVCTEVLDSRPSLLVRSRLLAAEVIRVGDRGANQQIPLPISQPAEPIALPPENKGNGLLVRVPGESLSYAEMVNPVDFRCSQFAWKETADTGHLAELSHQWALDHLEKGVILRARVRGLWFSRDDDVTVAAEAYRDFLAAKPLLST